MRIETDENNPKPETTLKYITISLLLVVLCTTLFAATTDTYIRLDADQRGEIAWVGASNGDWCHDVIFFMGPSWIEGDLGKFFHLPGGNDVMPMMGLSYDPPGGKLNWVVPQLIWDNSNGKYWSELSMFFYLRATKTLTTTHWIEWVERYQITPDIRIGPQIEWFHDYTAKSDYGRYAGIGMKIPYGGKCTLDIALNKDLQHDKAVVKVTFVGYLN